MHYFGELADGEPAEFGIWADQRQIIEGFQENGRFVGVGRKIWIGFGGEVQTSDVLWADTEADGSWQILTQDRQLSVRLERKKQIAIKY